ncbi:MAG: ribosome biogenesis GTPase Der, partial [Verrucomicrobia bacterium]|nr:ribosome biogenesis GTPase Der [Verrucomicrobiota bacterium]
MSKQRMIAIVGRPNVGKSAIYNRLAGRRIAIVHSESGVTRDRLVCKAEWAGQTYQLVDTGGLGTVDDVVGVDAITAGVRNQVEAALADAAVALLVVDVESGVLPLDAAVAGWLRKSGCQTLVVANKADNAERDNHAVDFAELGFPVFPVSALHDRGFPVLMRAALAALPPKGEGAEQGETPADPLRVAIVGRPNVGKSSYINRLLGDARVIVSNVPGTTRDSVDIPFVVGTGPTARHYLLIDTAGVRRKGKIDTLVERFSRMRTEETIARAHVVVLMLDAATGPTTQDKKVAAIIAEHRRGATLFVNKWDLAQATQTKYDPALREALPFLAHCPIVYLSANSGFNIRRSLEAIDQVATQVHAHLPTGILNRVLLDAAERVQPPAIGGKRFKAYYAAQVGRDPIRVRIFANHGAGIPQAYRDFLVRSLREKFGLEGAPVEIQFAERRREPRDGGTRPKRKPLTGAGAAA